MSWREFREKGRIVERNFYKKHCKSIVDVYYPKEKNEYQTNE